jgi:bifunctional UDP-N-acetylglucosamine pyrophosphorylase/glucosamine-1-phosphate N-acetyltransferase
MALNVVILAAGQGKRMHSALPKVLHPLAGKSLLAHVIATARELKPARICVVYGYGGEQVPDAVRGEGLIFVEQQPQLGTGHALKQALPHLDQRASTLVLYGDVPLITAATLAALIAGQAVRLKILTAEVAEPRGYGRIVRNAKGAITAIVEERTRRRSSAASAKSIPASCCCPASGSRAGLPGFRTATRNASIT